MPYCLINARPSPYGRKVAVALIEKGIAFDTIYDEPWGPASCTGRYNPLRQLPILVTPDGKSICDSSHILDWLEITHPSPALLPQDSAARLDALNMKTLGERLMEIAQSLIFEMHRPEPGAAWIERQTEKIVGGLAELERLAATAHAEDFATIHLGHIAVATTLLVWEFVVADGISPPIAALRWRDGHHCALMSMVEQLEQSPSFIRTRPMAMDLDIAAAVT